MLDLDSAVDFTGTTALTVGTAPASGTTPPPLVRTTANTIRAEYTDSFSNRPFAFATFIATSATNAQDVFAASAELDESRFATRYLSPSNCHTAFGTPGNGISSYVYQCPFEVNIEDTTDNILGRTDVYLYVAYTRVKDMDDPNPQWYLAKKMRLVLSLNLDTRYARVNWRSEQNVKPLTLACPASLQISEQFQQTPSYYYITGDHVGTTVYSTPEEVPAVGGYPGFGFINYFDYRLGTASERYLDAGTVDGSFLVTPGPEATLYETGVNVFTRTVLNIYGSYLLHFDYNIRLSVKEDLQIAPWTEPMYLYILQYNLGFRDPDRLCAIRLVPVPSA
jgi:hypothetical protein